MNEMIERLVQAVRGVQIPIMRGEDAIGVQQIPREMAKAVALAAIRAAREPTEAMQIAGHNVRNDPQTGLPTVCGTDEIYTAMIDEALRD